MKTIAILGSTGSIGKNTLKVISQLPGEFKVVALAAGKNASLFAEQINRFSPKVAAIMDEAKFLSLKKKVDAHTKLLAGCEAIEQIAAFGADIVVMAISGTAALVPTLKCLEKTKRLALANKECLVMAGDIVMRKAKRHNVEIIPIDSEHSAIFQCLKDEGNSSLERIYLTGSGGPLRDIAQEALEFIEPEFALCHPKWRMGKKISIDSATLMNKGFEMIEAHYLFGLALDKIKVVIHPQALIHSLVQFVDGTILAQLGIPDMCIPIQYALTYPQRLPSRLSRIDFTQVKQLSFHFPDLAKFPCLDLAMQVARRRGLAQAVLCISDEECVAAFLEGKIRITDISRIIAQVLAKLKNRLNPTLTEILQIDKWTREQVRKIITN